MIIRLWEIEIFDTSKNEWILEKFYYESKLPKSKDDPDLKDIPGKQRNAKLIGNFMTGDIIL